MGSEYSQELCDNIVRPYDDEIKASQASVPLERPLIGLLRALHGLLTEIQALEPGKQLNLSCQDVFLKHLKGAHKVFSVDVDASEHRARELRERIVSIVGASALQDRRLKVYSASHRSL